MNVLVRREIDLDLEPVDVARGLSYLDGMIFLDSSGNLPSGDECALSIICADPVQVIEGVGCDFGELREVMSGFMVEDGSPMPNGGAFGWIGYGGDFCFGIYDSALIYDHGACQWYEVGDLSGRLRACDVGGFELGEFKAHTSRDEYITGVMRVQEYIRAGDIYQVNLTQRYSASVSGGSLFSLYSVLREEAPAPMAAYMNLCGREVLSSSPEVFLKMRGRVIETRPIKGTRPRYEGVKEDDASAMELLGSEKERSELVMITDLERNDLGKICEYGSVRVDEMLQLERLAHVYHLVSRVSGRLRDGVDHFSAVGECFPGGSITGAPKLRAMEIIDELEGGERGLYTGALGYVGFNGASQFNIVIRTLVREGDVLNYSVGAGIVSDSCAAAEYDETLHKAKGIRRALSRLVGL